MELGKIPYSSYISGILPNGVVIMTGDGFNTTMKVVPVSTFELLVKGNSYIKQITKTQLRLWFRMYGCNEVNEQILKKIHEIDEVMSEYLNITNTVTNDLLIDTLIK